MTKPLICMLLAVSAAAAPLQAQPSTRAEPNEAQIRAAYAALDASVVKIRTVADLEYTTPDPISGFTAVIKRPLSVFGTGMVVGEIEIDGRTEYLVMTNHHVADVSNYVVADGRFLRENKHNTREVPEAKEETHLVASEAEGAEAIQLLEVVRHVQGDMTLLRTVNAPRDLAPPSFRIGYRAGEIQPGALVVTSGFPSGADKVIAVGRVVETARRHELGIPHVDFTVDLPVERGQSGSPVFLVEPGDGENGSEVRFTLIGLLHANEGGQRYVVPFELWKDSLAEMPAPFADRLVR